MNKIIARKRFGQNFLQDTHIIDAIVQAINPKPEDNLVEIGPGRGALTFPILKKVKNLTGIEIDRDLIVYLKPTQGLHLIEADALKFDYKNILSENCTRSPSPAGRGMIRLYGNLPYNISTPLLLHLLHFMPHIQDCHFMVQKEVAERIVAAPMCKDYGRLSVMIQYFCNAEILFSVSPDAFYPKPKVDSSIIRLLPHALSPFPEIPFEKLEFVVKQAFSQRRKTLKNNFKGILVEKDWEKLNINPQSRPEELSVSAFCKITQHML